MTSPDAAAAPDTAAAPASRRWLTLSVVGLAQLMVVLDNTIVNIALPSAQADLGFSDGDRQWVITAYALAFGSLLLLGGRLSDLIGRKVAFVIGLIGFAGASALGGAAQSFEWLVAARAAQGAFGALLAPTALAVLTTTFTIPKERARAFGVFGAIAGAGGAIGLLLGGVLTENLDWRWNLYVNIPIAVLAILGALVLVPALHRHGPRPRLDLPGTVLASAGLFLIVFGFSRAETDGWDSVWCWGSLIAAAVMLAAFAFWQTRAAHPLLPLSILRDRNRAGSYLTLAIASAGMFGVFLFVTYYVQVSLGYTPIQTGVGFLPLIIMLVIAAQLGTNVLIPRLGPKIMVPFGLTVLTIGMIYLTHLDLDSQYALDIMPPLMIIGFGMGSTMPAAFQGAALGVDRQFAGVASAMANTSQQVGGSIGTALLNTLAANALTDYLADHQPPTPAIAAEAAIHSYNVAYWCSAALFGAGAVLLALLFRRRGQGLSLAHVSRRGAAPEGSAEPSDEPVIAH
ncbi:MAG: MFS transporter [Actinomycetales bacterium]|nr:MFS transporter [Actinomycetales bacterium]